MGWVRKLLGMGPEVKFGNTGPSRAKLDEDRIRRALQEHIAKQKAARPPAPPAPPKPNVPTAEQGRLNMLEAQVAEFQLTIGDMDQRIKWLEEQLGTKHKEEVLEANPEAGNW